MNCSCVRHRLRDKVEYAEPVATNSKIFNKLEEDMDINCGEILDGTVSVQEMGQKIFELFLRTTSGEASKSEKMGLGDYEFVPWQIGIMS